MRLILFGFLCLSIFSRSYSQSIPLSAGTIGSSQTICYNTAPARLYQLIKPRRGTGSYTYQWQYSIDKILWDNIGGETSTSYAPPVLTENRWYRMRVTSGSNSVVTNSVLITVNSSLTSGSIEREQTICYDTPPVPLRQLTSPTGGTGKYEYQWQSSLNNSSWSDISEANSPDYYSPSLTSDIYYRRIVKSESCGSVNSEPVFIKVYPELSPGTVGTSQSVCFNASPERLTQLSSPSGGMGFYNYQWQMSEDNENWTNIPGATFPDYQPLSLTADTYFRRTIMSGTCISISVPVLITVNSPISGVQLHDDISIFSNTSAVFNAVVSGGESPFTIYYTRNGVAQTVINNYTSGTDIPTGTLLTGNYTYALTSVTDSRGCSAQGSGLPITVTVFASLTPGSIGTTQSVCYNTVPAPLTQIAAPAGGSENYTYQWESSADNASWTNIAGATLPGYSPPALTANIYYRRTVTSNNTSVSSSSVLISVLPGITDVQLHDNATIYDNTSASFNIVISGGTSPYTINYTRNGVAQTTINNYDSGADVTTGTLNSGSYLYALTSVTDSRGCLVSESGNPITITVYPPLTPGSIGAEQSVCYNTTPDPLTQTAAPTGGSGNYTYQWQRSANNVNWTNISGATLSGYQPPALIAAAYYRRVVRSGSSLPVNSDAVLINVLAIAQLFDNITIYNNSSANFKVTISGGTGPFTIRYRKNGITQTSIENYYSGTAITTGILTTGTYVYRLTSVTDENGYEACDLGTEITVTVLSDLDERSNNALVIVNSGSSSYSDYTTFIKPYLENFGFSYNECNVNATELPELADYAIIIFGHRNVYSSGYPFSELETAVAGGTGLYSFDPHLFDYSSGFNTLIPQKAVSSRLISIPNTSHYITQYHAPDEYSPSNNSVNLLNSWTVVQRSNLVGGTDLASMSSGEQTVSLLQVANYGTGKVVKWCGYNWVFDNILGPVYGMDDLLWRGIVWAARKPFAMQGMPPLITMRVDDATGSDGGVTDDFNWVKICNEFGLIPWCGTFNNMIAPEYIPTLKNLIDNNKATAFPHSFTWQKDFIYFNHNNLEFFDAAANVRAARDFYNSNGLRISNYLVPHYYEISSEALPEIKAMGGDFIATHMLPDQHYYSEPMDLWLNCGPYRLNRTGYAELSRPVYYGGNVTLNGIEFFNCLTEIRDDGSYEWFPDNNVVSTTARGIRHLRRSLNSMVLSSLFTHEYYITPITTVNWRDILSRITSAISGYDPEYTSTDYAVRYIRARNNIRITNVVEKNLFTEISYSGTNDMDTKCYLFTEESGEINYHFVPLPRVSGNNKVNDPK
jgi:hypothetical protein